VVRVDEFDCVLSIVVVCFFVNPVSIVNHVFLFLFVLFFLYCNEG